MPRLKLLHAALLIGIGINITGVVPIRAAQPKTRVLSGQMLEEVVQGTAKFIGHHNPITTITLNIALGVHDSAKLDAMIASASDSGSPSYGHYLSLAQFRAQYAPTDSEVQAVKDWATAGGLVVDAVSPDNLLVIVHGAEYAVEQLLQVSINDYTIKGIDFASNDRDATVPVDLDILAITGLNSTRNFHIDESMGVPTGKAYKPTDFRNAYNVAPVGDGSGQTIGLILWGKSQAQRDLDTFADLTGTAPLVSGKPGTDGIDWIFVTGKTTDMYSNDENLYTESAMDAEYAHAMAPGSHLKVWLARCSVANDKTAEDPGACEPSYAGMELAISDAANDPSVHVVSNSWTLIPENRSAPEVLTISESLQRAAAGGTTFYFGSGDHGGNSGCPAPYPSPKTVTSLPLNCGRAAFPTDSPYVVSVGGTTLVNTTPTEKAWADSGGGCTTWWLRPSWQSWVQPSIQLGVNKGTCTGRAVPDVSADGDGKTDAFVWVLGNQASRGTGAGTSLATPLWAGMAADINHYLAANNEPLMGFALPRIYDLANDPTTYARDFHNVNTLANGVVDPVGWNQATGWGSPNLANLAQDWASSFSVKTPSPPRFGGGGGPLPNPAGGFPAHTWSFTYLCIANSPTIGPTVEADVSNDTALNATLHVQAFLLRGQPGDGAKVANAIKATPSTCGDGHIVRLHTTTYGDASILSAIHSNGATTAETAILVWSDWIYVLNFNSPSVLRGETPVSFTPATQETITLAISHYAAYADEAAGTHFCDGVTPPIVNRQVDWQHVHCRS